MSKVIEVHGDLSKWVNSSEKRLVVIDFFATWCGPCRRMHPIYDELSLTYTNVVFLRVDSDENRELSGSYAVTGLPTFVFVLRGNEVDRVVGADDGAVRSKIEQYATSASSFTGSGMSLGGSSAKDAATAREMRLKKLQNVKIQGTGTSEKLTRMMDKAAYSEEEEEVKPAVDESDDAVLRDNLKIMGFPDNKIDMTFKNCTSRDIGDLVAYITSLPDQEEQPAQETTEQPQVICDGNECHVVPPSKKLSFEERLQETKMKIQQKKEEKEKLAKEQAKQNEKDRIERGKADQAQREELERLQRQRELEKEKQEKIAMEQEKKRQLELWRKEHGLPPEEKKVVAEKTPEEKAKLLVESIALQRFDGSGPAALKTLNLILTNAGKEDPKYRSVRKDSKVMQNKIEHVPGALPLMHLVGFELEGDNYVMHTYNEPLVKSVLNMINARL